VLVIDVRDLSTMPLLELAQLVKGYELWGVVVTPRLNRRTYKKDPEPRSKSPTKKLTVKELVQNKPTISNKEVADILGRPEPSVRRDIWLLRKKGELSEKKP
jgi:hypothetical protein